MTPRPPTNIARFVRSAWMLISFQLIAAVGAAALALWAVIEVRGLVDQRDALAAQVAALESSPPIEPLEAPARSFEEPKAAASQPVSSVPAPGAAPVRPARVTTSDGGQPRNEVIPVKATETRLPDEIVPVRRDRPQDPKVPEPVPGSVTERR